MRQRQWRPPCVGPCVGSVGKSVSGFHWWQVEQCLPSIPFRTTIAIVGISLLHEQPPHFGWSKFPPRVLRSRQLGGDRLVRERGTEIEAAFFRRDVLALLEARGAQSAIRVPFQTWTGLREIVRTNRSWTPVDASVSCFERQGEFAPWQRRLRVVIYRTRVHHETRKNFQLDLFDPADGHYEYSAVVTNKPLSGRYLWHFMCGRGGHEKAYGELKSGFAFASVPSLQYAANSAWQQLSVLAFNLMRGFQVAAGLVVQRSRTAGRRPLFAFRSIDIVRYELLHRAGIVLHPDGRPTLEVGTTAAVRKQFLAIDNRLPRAA